MQGEIVQHLYYQANPNSTASPWGGGPAMCPAWWGHAVSTFGSAGDLVRWTEVAPTAIRGGSGAIIALPPNMLDDAAGESQRFPHSPPHAPRTHNQQTPTRTARTP